METKDNITQIEDYMRLFVDNITSEVAWKLLPGSVYKLSYSELVSIITYSDFNEIYRNYGEGNLNKFTVTICGRYMKSHIDYTLIFVKEIGRAFDIDSDTVIPTTGFIKLEDLNTIERIRKAHEYMISLEQ